MEMINKNSAEKKEGEGNSKSNPGGVCLKNVLIKQRTEDHCQGNNDRKIGNSKGIRAWGKIRESEVRVGLKVVQGRKEIREKKTRDLM